MSTTSDPPDGSNRTSDPPDDSSTTSDPPDGSNRTSDPPDDSRTTDPPDNRRSVADDRRRAVASAGHTGDVETARAAVTGSDPELVGLGLRALERLEALDDTTLTGALTHTDHRVRRRAAELAADHPGIPLAGALRDDDARVVEMAAWAAGERTYRHDEHVLLQTIASDHADSLCREAAVAALGAVGHTDGRAAVLAALDDIATVRRRAVLALAAFDGPDVEAALWAATTDRDHQVRQAAEDLLGSADS